MQQVAAGDLVAFGDLYDDLAPTVFGTAIQIVRNRELAEEVTQDVFTWVWRSAASFQAARGTATALVLTVTRRRAIDAVRHEESVRRRAALPQTEALTSPIDAYPFTRTEGRRQVDSLLAELTELQREVIRLSYWEELSGAELAARLGIKLATAKTRKRDGLTRMRSVLKAVPVAG
jgi:RNA polymerase sigma-70 factor, ECF subfamily